MSHLAALSSARDPRLPVVTFLVLFAVFFCGCNRKTPPKPAVVTSTASVGVGSSVPASEEEAVQRLEANFARVHFEFDSTRLTRDGAALLDENARILAGHPGLVVEIQGHTDPRGSTSYNLALGTLRAETARSRMVARGIGSDRLPTVTYGEERLLRPGDSEQDHAQNRRVEIGVVRGGADGIAGTVD